MPTLLRPWVVTPGERDRDIAGAKKPVKLMGSRLAQAELHDERQQREASHSVRAESARGRKAPTPMIFCETMAELVQRVGTQPKPRMLVNELLTEGGTGLLHGQPRSRKTIVTLEMVIAVASGKCAFHLGRFQCDRVPVLYITEEDSDYTIMSRAVWIARAHGLGDVVDGLDFMVRKGTDLDDAECQERILGIIRDRGHRLVAIDPARSVTRCVDKGPSELAPFAAYVRRLKAETGAAVLIAHHDTKPAPIAAADEREHPQKASGGGMFSISDSPISCQRVGSDQSLLVPSHFKFGKADPEPFIVRIETPDEFEDSPAYEMAVVGQTKAESAAMNEEMDRKVLDVVHQNVCESGADVERIVGKRAVEVRASLKRLAQGGQLIQAKLTRGNGFHYRAAGTPSCGKCREEGSP